MAKPGSGQPDPTGHARRGCAAPGQLSRCVERRRERLVALACDGRPGAPPGPAARRAAAMSGARPGRRASTLAAAPSRAAAPCCCTSRARRRRGRAARAPQSRPARTTMRPWRETSANTRSWTLNPVLTSSLRRPTPSRLFTASLTASFRKAMSEAGAGGALTAAGAARLRLRAGGRARAVTGWWPASASTRGGFRRRRRARCAAGRPATAGRAPPRSSRG